MPYWNALNFSNAAEFAASPTTLAAGPDSLMVYMLI